MSSLRAQPSHPSVGSWLSRGDGASASRLPHGRVGRKETPWLRRGMRECRALGHVWFRAIRSWLVWLNRGLDRERADVTLDPARPALTNERPEDAAAVPPGVQVRLAVTSKRLEARHLGYPEIGK